jgi:hypothetical protein
LRDELVGRSRELGLLEERLRAVQESGAGIAVTLRGRQQVGKSRLVQELCDRTQVPHIYLTANKGAGPTESIQRFATEIAESGIMAESGGAQLAPAENWVNLFRALDDLITDRAAIVVIDEVPWLAEQDRTFDGALQLAWDRYLGRLRSMALPSRPTTPKPSAPTGARGTRSVLPDELQPRRGHRGEVLPAAWSWSDEGAAQRVAPLGSYRMGEAIAGLCRFVTDGPRSENVCHIRIQSLWTTGGVDSVGSVRGHRRQPE